MPSVLFLSLDTFSRIGGIQQFNRLFSLALWRNAEEKGWRVRHISLWDTHVDPQYFPPGWFSGCGRGRGRFLARVVREARSADVIVLGHINLALVGLVLRFLFPRTRQVLLAHGVEVWQPLGRVASAFLGRADAVWAVSQFTANQLSELHGVDAQRIQILHNTLDPAFTDAAADNTALLQERWRLGNRHPVLLTVARLRHTEEAKGYDKVLEALPALIEAFPQLVYVLAGPWDEVEYQRVQQKARDLGVAGHLAMPGSVDRSLLPGLYRHSQVFVMPSTKEGFGIVFLEAAWCGTRVVAADAGGAPEALLQGRLGMLVPPGNPKALEEALIQALSAPLTASQQAEQKKLVAEQFGFDNFTRRQASLLAASI